MVTRLFAASLALLVFAGCSGSRPRDAAGDRRPGRRGATARDAGDATNTSAGVPAPPERLTQDAAPTTRARFIVRARSRALATTSTRLYYGDIDEDGIFAVEKAGGTPTRIARRAPASGGLALDDDMVAWVASPGDAVLRTGLNGGPVAALRDKGIFSGVAARGGDVFIAEAIGAGGAITRVTAATTSRLTTFDGPPRGIVVDNTHAYLVTRSRVYKVARNGHGAEADKAGGGELVSLASGARLDHPQLDGQSVYFIGAEGDTLALMRVAKAGGPTATLARDVRDAPIAITPAGDEIFYFDAARTQIRAVRTDGSPGVRTVVDDPMLSEPTALVADGTTLFVATGEGPDAAVVAYPARR